MAYVHTPVMLAEVLQRLDPKPGETFVDGTVGGCGHAVAVCEAIEPGGVFIGMDQDQDAIDNAFGILNRSNAIVHLFHGNFVQMPDFLSRLNISAVDGILLDLGISYHHIAFSGRGFSFSKDEPLDMRMDLRSGTTAGHLVNTLDEGELGSLFRRYGEEPRARQIARRITMERKRKTISTSSQLAAIVSRCVPQAGRKPGLHPATRVFMALRIAVNSELECLERFLDSAVDFLKPGGRICILAFHSLEDRIVKHRFRSLENPCTCPPDLPTCACGRKALLQVLTRKAQRPSAEEVAVNPMSRSTRLRAAIRLCA